MKYFTTLILSAFLFLHSYGQKKKISYIKPPLHENCKKKNSVKCFTREVQKEAYSKVKLPFRIKKVNTVRVQFTINSNGKIQHISKKSGSNKLYPYCEKAVLKMKPFLKSAMYKRKKVPYTVSIPFYFNPKNKNQLM